MTVSTTKAARIAGSTSIATISTIASISSISTVVIVVSIALLVWLVLNTIITRVVIYTAAFSSIFSIPSRTDNTTHIIFASIFSITIGTIPSITIFDREAWKTS